MAKKKRVTLEHVRKSYEAFAAVYAKLNGADRWADRDPC
jgi:hypothetical protein